MVDIIGLVSNLVTPFFEHPVLLFFFILLIVGVDSWGALTGNHTTILTNGGHYIITEGILGGPVCLSSNAGDVGSNWIGSLNSHLPSKQELQTLCLNKEDLGTFGGIFTGILNTSGDLANIGALQDAKVSSWMIFALMLCTTILVWTVTASTRS